MSSADVSCGYNRNKVNNNNKQQKTKQIIDIIIVARIGLYLTTHKITKMENKLRTFYGNIKLK